MAVNVNIPKPTYTKNDIGLGNVDNTSDLNKPISTAGQMALDDKVDKVTGKGLSENDLTDALKITYDDASAWVTDVGLDLASRTTNTNTGDETATTIKQKLEIFEAKQTSAVQSTTGTTVVAITELKVTPTINKRYKLTACIHIGSANTNGVFIGLTAPSGANVFLTAFGTSNPGTTNSIMSFINASGQLFQNAYTVSASDNGMCIVQGEIEMGATAGDVQFTFRHAIAGSTARILKTGSFMKLEEI